MPESGTGQPTQLECGQSVVIVGANGAGKTRLGVLIETTVDMQSLSTGILTAQRIAAQKSLAMPEYVKQASVNHAKAMLHQGISENITEWPNKAPEQIKYESRWNSKPETHLLDDYSQVMAYLFSEEFDVNLKFRNSYVMGQAKASPVTRLDILKRIGGRVLPDIELVIDAGEIKTQNTMNTAPQK